MIRSLIPALFLFLCAWQAPAAAGPGPAVELDKWLEGLGDPDPFVSKMAEAEVRNLGEAALLPLARIVAGEPGGGGVSGRIQSLRVEKILREILGDFLRHLESEYHAMELDRRELEQLTTRLTSLGRLKELREKLTLWKSRHSGIEAGLKTGLKWKRLAASVETAKKSGVPVSEDDRGLLEALGKKINLLRDEVPGFNQMTSDYSHLQKLEAVSQGLESKSEVTRLRAKDLRERNQSREPRVQSLIRRLKVLGSPALLEIAARRELLALRENPPAGEKRTTCQRLYDALLAEALDEMSAGGRLIGKIPAPGGYNRGILWALEVDRKGGRAEAVLPYLKKHIRTVLLDLDSGESLVRDRARMELYRLGDRGIKALHGWAGETASPGSNDHSFLAGLLRWRIRPEVYERVGIHFNDYSRLPFAARRRRIFQYARAAGESSISTLRAIVENDELEESFLVKYAAARALMTQLSDRWGFLVLQERNPDLVLKRPEVSRDLLLLQGLAFVRSRDYQGAVREFRKVIDEYPFDFEGNYHLGFSFLLLKNYPQAIHHFEIAARINPEDELTLYNLACACSLAGKPEKALDALEKSVEAGFNDPDHMENDEDLNAIRDLDGYKRILEMCRKR